MEQSEAAQGLNYGAFADLCLTLDLETGVGDSSRIHDVGALFRQREFRCKKPRTSHEAAERLTAFGKGAVYVVGHNIVAHDRRFIEAHLPGSELLDRPVVDTLYLAPLAKPQRPYHHLVKDYKLVGGERSNPVVDCRLALLLLANCWQILERSEQESPGLVSIYRSCFDDSDAPGGHSPLRLNGTGAFLEALGGRLMPPERVINGFEHFAEGRACPSQVRRELPALLVDPLTRPVVAYALAWLRVAGTESVLPRWVHRSFPATSEFLREIRSRRCRDADCAYCSEHHSPQQKLRQYFHFPEFRPEPKTTEGDSLQERIVTRGFERRSVLAILPTGGGKSLCYQLPAIVHNERTGALTVVISPLQALMKDQVESLNKRTEPSAFAAALNGLLTMPERHDVLEGIRLGRYALLYVSPEQLRSTSFKSAVRQREIATWVFDEAHCISKWGHDFRTDYWYAARFIREFTAEEFGPDALPAPIACFTATAKFDVRQEIVAHIRDELGHALDVLSADRVDRDNLQYTVEEVPTARKGLRTHELLEEHLGDPRAAAHRGSAIVYAARRRRTEEISRELRGRGWNAAHFHAGLEGPEKQRVQEGFIDGEIPVIVATNAFGMGIDKDNVRLVVHVDAPGSIENYLQEAGRAGRDRESAECVLLFAKGDVETQFDLASHNRLTKRDIAQILAAIRKARRADTDEIVVSPGELLRVPDVDVSFDHRERSASTKVKTAISWLERAKFVLRNENRTYVFQGVPAVPDMDAARKRIDELDLTDFMKQRYLEVIGALLEADPRDGFDADQLAHLPSFRHMKSHVGDDARGKDRTASREIIRTLLDMNKAKLVDRCLYFSAHVRHKIKDPSVLRLDRLLQLERSILDLLRTHHPDVTIGEPLTLSLPDLQEQLRAQNTNVLRESATKLMFGWAREGFRSHPPVAVKGAGRHRLEVTLDVDWAVLEGHLALRARVASVILGVLSEEADKQGARSTLLVGFSLEAVRSALEGQLDLSHQIGDPFTAIEKTLLFLDEHQVIKLHKGLSIFRQAMTLRLRDAAKRGYRDSDYRHLQNHYDERVFQIHAMGRYVEEAQSGLDGGRGFVQQYFGSRVSEFKARYFADDAEMIKRATSRESYRSIVEDLNHDAQQAIVESPMDKNVLVLAGPGAGKTRVVVHRCAFLLRVKRIPPESILVVCFNRSAMHELRVRLRDLVGDLARHVAVHTYHSLALRLTERSLAARVKEAGEAHINFDEILDEANRRLSGDAIVEGIEPDALRDRLLSGFEHVLVDEYQDIDERQYTLINHIARRAGGEDDEDRRATILAVGDDDQSIYGFRHANVEFLRRFEREFDAERHYLVENFRSTQHIVDAANGLIRHNSDRMKTEQPIQLNQDRIEEPPGGSWGRKDPVTKGQVSLMQVEDRVAQAISVVAELERLSGYQASIDWNAFAVLGRWNRDLHSVRALLERHGIPIRRAVRKGLPPLSRLREFAMLFEHLQRIEAGIVSVTELRKNLVAICGTASFWTEVADRELAGVEAEFGSDECPVATVAECLHRALADQQRTHVVGTGVLVSTVHSAKGLEFPHVFVLGGDWGTRPRAANSKWRPSDPEEERRTYYVAMTRAQYSLTLFDRQDDPSPFASEVGQSSLRRRSVSVAEGFPAELADVEYEVLGMKDLYIDYAGQQPAGRRIHRALADLQTGDRLEFVASEKSVTVRTPSGVSVARLSAAAALRWQAQIQGQQVDEIRVLGIALRVTDDSHPDYRDRIQVEQWELPLLEVRHRLPWIR